MPSVYWCAFKSFLLKKQFIKKHIPYLLNPLGHFLVGDSDFGMHYPVATQLFVFCFVLPNTRTCDDVTTQAWRMVRQVETRRLQCWCITVTLTLVAGSLVRRRNLNSCMFSTCPRPPPKPTFEVFPAVLSIFLRKLDSTMMLTWQSSDLPV